MKRANPLRGRRWLTSRNVFLVHGWLGMKLSILLVVIVLTGVAASVSHEIDWMLNAALRVTPGTTRVSWGTLYERVQEAFPEACVSWLQAPHGPRFAAEVGVYVRDDERPRRVYVNPYSGQVQGVAGGLNAQRVLRDLHRRLFLPEWIGIYVISSFGFVLLGSAVTGLWVYKQWWRGLFRLRLDSGR